MFVDNMDDFESAEEVLGDDCLGGLHGVDVGEDKDVEDWDGCVQYDGARLIKAGGILSGHYTIRDGTTTVSENAFSGCRDLIEITIPDSVTIIEDGAFEGCNGLKSIEIPNNMVSIGYRVFNGCDKLRYVEYENAKYLGNSNNRHLYLWKTISSTTIDFTIHHDVKFMDYDAFFGCKLATINWDAANCEQAGAAEHPIFADCKDLISVNLGNNVKKIPRYAFCGCRGLTSINIPDGAISIGEYAFKGCSNLTTITIPNGLRSIGAFAFSGCNKIHIQNMGMQSIWGTKTTHIYIYGKL